MGIFNNGGKFNNLISAIQSIKENPVIFTSCQHSRISLNPGVKTLIVPATEPRIRRITIKNAGGDSVIIFKGENVTVTESAFDLVPGGKLVDDQDGGIAWYAKSQVGSVLDIAIESTPGVTS